MGDTGRARPGGGISPSLRRLVDAGARWVLLPAWRGYSGATWLEGLILAESSGDPGAMRYEPHLDRAGASDPDGTRRDDGLQEDDRSYGLMQVLGTNLRSMVGVSPATRMDLSWALFPMANLAFGLRLLAALLNQANKDVADRIALGPPLHDAHTLFVLEGPVDLALAHYNGGLRGNAAADWPNLRNLSYVDRVARHAEVARERRRRVNWIEAE